MGVHFVHKRINGHLFRAFLYYSSALSQTEHEPQGGEKASAELDG